ncbi:hypothetical protein RHMOL_Rhmol04G0255400 [Rhododendron molle]|uniref:Uncharacterized protein n=1 Tax=Rhododendron molle TaxID=49168 RepID=A0ACC0P4K7_RHOML|nr:hypothetical protein RHMOL_Rhmol04G0255400 [Rhododendron molle]
MTAKDMLRTFVNAENVLNGNDVVFNNKLWRPDAACTAAICEAVYFLKSNQRIPRIGDSGHATIVGEQVEWRKPMTGWVKINFDGGLDNLRKSSGLGIVIRDSRGHFRAARVFTTGI